MERFLINFTDKEGNQVNKIIEAKDYKTAIRLANMAYGNQSTSQFSQSNVKTSKDLKEEAKQIQEDYKKTGTYYEPKSPFEDTSYENIAENIAQVAFPFASSLAQHGYGNKEILGASLVDASLAVTPAIAAEKLMAGALPRLGKATAGALAARPILGKLAATGTEAALTSGADIVAQEATNKALGYNNGVNLTASGLVGLGVLGGQGVTRALGKAGDILKGSGMRTYERALIPSKIANKSVNPPDIEWALKNTVDYTLTPKTSFESTLEKGDIYIKDILDKRDEFIENNLKDVYMKTFGKTKKATEKSSGIITPEYSVVGEDNILPDLGKIDKGSEISTYTKGSKEALQDISTIERAREKVMSDEGITPMLQDEILKQLDNIEESYLNKYGEYLPIGVANKQITNLSKESNIFAKSMDANLTPKAKAYNRLSSQLNEDIASISPRLRQYSKDMAPPMSLREPLLNAISRTGGQGSPFTDMMTAGVAGIPGLAYKKLLTTPVGAKLQYDIGRLLGGLGSEFTHAGVGVIGRSALERDVGALERQRQMLLRDRLGGGMLLGGNK